MKRTETIASGKITFASGRKVSECERLKPLGDSKKAADFYELAALQHGRLAREGYRNPSATLAQISGAALPTAQGRPTKARDRELMPPGRRGSQRHGTAVRFFAEWDVAPHGHCCPTLG